MLCGAWGRILGFTARIDPTNPLGTKPRLRSIPLRIHPVPYSTISSLEKEVLFHLKKVHFLFNRHKSTMSSDEEFELESMEICLRSGDIVL